MTIKILPVLQKIVQTLHSKKKHVLEKPRYCTKNSVSSTELNRRT